MLMKQITSLSRDEHPRHKKVVITRSSLDLVPTSLVVNTSADLWVLEYWYDSYTKLCCTSELSLVMVTVGTEFKFAFKKGKASKWTVFRNDETTVGAIAIKNHGCVAHQHFTIANPKAAHSLLHIFPSHTGNEPQPKLWPRTARKWKALK